MNGDKSVQTTRDENGVETDVPPKTAQAILARQRERKAKSILLLAILDEYKLSIDEVNTANGVSTAAGHRSSRQASSSSYTDDLMFSFFASQLNSPQLDDEDLKEIDHDDLEEMGLKCKEPIGSDKTKVECFNYHRRGQFARECRALRNQGNRNEDASSGSDTEKNEVTYEEKIAVLEFEVKDKGNAITRLTNQLDQTLKEKKDLKAKLEQFEISSKNLNKLINSQLSAKDKTGLGYGDKLSESDSEVLHSVFDSRSSDGDDNPTNDRFKKRDEYHLVPPPLIGNYMPPLADLSFVRLDDSVYRPTTNKARASISKGRNA
nr:hypothetical protein [Tanacetum cinerariifolium]